MLIILSLEYLKRMEDAEGQGHSQEPQEICPPIESANIQRCPNSEIFTINEQPGEQFTALDMQIK